MNINEFRRSFRVACAFLIAFAFVNAPAYAGPLEPGDVQTVLTLGFPNSPEGIAFDKQGNMYVSNRFYDFGAFTTKSEIFKVRRNGQMSLFADLPDLDGFWFNDPTVGFGVLGLVVDDEGNVYAAFDSRDEDTRGVWRIGRSGSNAQRLEGSGGMELPNALTFDDADNLYATDSRGGSVWRFPNADDEPWVQDDDLLKPAMPTGVGANGIAFFPPNHLYVANTQGATPFMFPGLIAGIDIGAEGDPENLQTIAYVPSPDGVAVDVRGDIYTVIPLPPFIPLSPVVKINRATMGFDPVTTPPPVGEPSQFNATLSLAFGRGNNKRSVFVTNGEIFGPPPPGSGFAVSGVVEVGIGVRGFDPFADDDDDEESDSEDD